MRMESAVARLQLVLNGVSTGRAHPQLLDGVRVECYGGQFPLEQVALVSIRDRTISIQPFDRSIGPDIERAIRASSLGLYPNRTKEMILVNVPPLTGERREELIRYVEGVAEEQRVAVRNIRRELLKEVDGLDLTEDDARSAKKEAETLTKGYIGQIDSTLAAKTHELRGGDNRVVFEESARRKKAFNQGLKDRNGGEKTV